MQTNQFTSDIRLLATDLDGTIIGDASEFSLYPTFRNILNVFKANKNFYWVVCTGRSLRGYRRLITPMVSMGNVPDFVITRHAFIMKWTGRYYMPHIFWNIGVLYHLLLHNVKKKSALNNAYKAVTSEVPGSRVLSQVKHTFTVRFQTDDAAEQAENICRTRKTLAGWLITVRQSRVLTVGVMPCAKALSLAELVYHLGITSDNVLVIGNGINDITMFHENVAKYTGCPYNSRKEVMELVKTRSGHIASRRSLGGVIEILEAYQNGNICSEIPDFSEENPKKTNDIARLQKIPSHHQKKHYAILRALLLLYIVLLVFASFDLIPFVSHLIIAPYQLIINAISKLFY